LEIGPALLALIPAQGWRSEYDVGGERCERGAGVGGRTAGERFGRAAAAVAAGMARRAYIEIIFRPWSPDEIIADVSLFDVQG